MRLKDPQNFSHWEFYLTDVEGKEIKVPTTGYAKSFNELVSMIVTLIEAYNEATNGQYSKQLMDEAKKHNVSFNNYIRMLVEHQICLRNKGTSCWSGGLGDSIHQYLSKVDDKVDSIKSQKVKKIIQRAIQRITPSHSPTFGGCSRCGGTRVMKPNVDNLGRAGKLNRKFK